MKNVYTDRPYLIPVFVYLILTIPFIRTVPFLDGNIDFVKSFDFFSGGFNLLFENWRSIHPPLKESVSYMFFTLFGVSSYTYNLPTLLLGTLGILSIYSLVKNIFNQKVALLSSMLLASCPLFISTGIFSLTDFILTNLILSSLYFYSSNKYFLFSIFAALSFLAKETGILLIISAFFMEVVFEIKNRLEHNKFKLEVKRIFFLLIPFFTSFIWSFFLKTRKHGVWSDWNFSEVSEKGTVYTILHNLATFNFLNKYAYQNWTQLFFLNFNWVYWVIIFIGFIIFIFKFPRIIKAELPTQIKLKTISVLTTFSLFYFLAVLSFQTYTIPRYSLPVYPFMYIWASYVLISLIRGRIKSNNYVLTFFSVLVFLRLFFSLDPLSTKFWGKINVLGQDLYGMNRYLSGNDGITYNLQYLIIAQKRSEYFKGGIVPEQSRSDDCHWLFLDPRNDIKTAKILNLSDELFIKCNLK